MLKVKGKRLYDGKGNEVILRGYNIGNWLMLENFMLGFPGVEQQFRYYMNKYGGLEKSRYFFESLAKSYIDDKDVAFLKQMGCNVIRVPFNYRLFENDNEPYKYKPEGFKYIDYLIELCKKHEIYIILDMHALPGYQNHDWHSDNETGHIGLFKEKTYQERTALLWQHIAERYANEETIAGYDLMNEPEANDDDVLILNSIYKYTTRLIREVDKNHILFYKGNKHSTSFEGFETPFDDNSIYACHFYVDTSIIEFRVPGTVFNRMYDKRLLEKRMDELDSFMTRHNVPCFIGEYGIYDNVVAFDEKKKRILGDLLDIFNERGHSWTGWSYKDIGNAGLVYPDPHSPWMQFTEKYFELKLKYHCDTDPTGYENWLLVDILKPYIEEDFRNEYNELYLTLKNSISKTFSNVLIERFSRELSGFGYEKLEKHTDSFKFENCSIREDWYKVIKSHLK
ncbi:MAG: cellulase family glycosylhydrolase [Bacillota bacterium]|nr:cellulase family glycosylhydrolase [Bacillota bacterium]